jgi:hypothetical protein
VKFIACDRGAAACRIIPGLREPLFIGCLTIRPPPSLPSPTRTGASCEIRSEKAEERREHDGTGPGNDDVAARHLEKAPASNWAQFLPRDHALWLGHNGRGATHSFLFFECFCTEPLAFSSPGPFSRRQSCSAKRRTNPSKIGGPELVEPFSFPLISWLLCELRFDCHQKPEVRSPRRINGTRCSSPSPSLQRSSSESCCNSSLEQPTIVRNAGFAIRKRNADSVTAAPNADLSNSKRHWSAWSYSPLPASKETALPLMCRLPANEQITGRDSFVDDVELV